MVNIQNENGTLNIALSGKIDSANAPILEKKIWDNADFANCSKIIVDAEELSMISSAGLRIMLKMRKLCSDFSIIGVNPDVYEVFDMTGFTEMLNVVKAYRKLLVDGC